MSPNQDDFLVLSSTFETVKERGNKRRDAANKNQAEQYINATTME
jgi:hypothetical protein